MVTVLEYEQAEIKLGLEVEVELLLVVPVVELGTTDGKGLAPCADAELEEGNGTWLLVLLLPPLVVKLIVVETDWKPENDELLTCELVEDKVEEAAALDTNVETEAVPKSVDDELCVDDALRMTKLDVVDEVLDCCEDDVDVKAVELSTTPEFEGPVKEEENTGGEKLERVASPVLTEVESSNVEEEFADNDVGTAETLLGWIEELEYGDEKDDVVLMVSTDNEEDVAKSGDTGAWLLSTLAELDAEGVVNRSVELSDELNLESPGEEDRSDDVEIYAVALLTSTSPVLV
ncbi:hypothetical protein KC349_g867 [Hortaea werneckii]|nr:hypothetical protein KC349_g867 [Hortaea werneckii]